MEYILNIQKHEVKKLFFFSLFSGLKIEVFEFIKISFQLLLLF